MRKALLLVLAATLSLLLSNCGTTNVASTVSQASGDSVPVSLTMTDDPPSGVSVLFFQVSLTGASLTSSSGSAVSLLPNSTPIQIDVTQLQALSAFLNAANVASGTYSGLSLTFANPQLVIFNTSDTALGSSCAVGAICELTPTFDNSATVNFTAAPFPATVSGSTPLGFLIDFHLNTIIQTDLSVNLGVANGVTVSEVPPNATGQAPPTLGFLTGTVGSVSGDQFTMATASGKTVTIDVNTNTVFIDWPPCASPGTLTCLKAGDAVQVQVAGVDTDGSLLAATVQWLQAANTQTVEGTVVGYSSSQIKLMLHASPTASTALPIGALATVNIASGATFTVDANGFTIPSGLVFAGIDNLTVGQEVKVDVVQGTSTAPTSSPTTGGWGLPPSLTFSTDNIELEPSQTSGTVSAIASPNFTLNYPLPPVCLPGGACETVIALLQVPVQTTSQTSYAGFDPDDFSGLADNDLVSVNGWLFESDNGLPGPGPVTPPQILAQTVTLHPGGNI